ncbi:hypothetical protein [Microbulbifer thermotolerans]|uniref:Lipoprotein n=1 Tax=Microbulbifer thermotolerans TaxID=252514 RepID=A0A143HQX5_MICTH|nr:hypothetical protein [Microbulbifer thermotolerans]AMX03682.1 hypothetical protein A3224_14795 [Microbulbifer thermotolerans]MCX2780954.1 hypothetical protein [Microbulbifer thermotolerans]MCX2782061.1 hypothetical protein [Microbulbifer thermotolerans]MCX2796192.1 hypothetical protein [Microbulbifer thermotolerans]MCX2802532.1 hypothetical protein [Microbulbifer thermotolerans]
MSRLCERVLASATCCVVMATSVLTLSACSGSGYSPRSTTVTGRAYYRFGGPYSHCHPDGVCHNARHPDYYWSGGYYRPRPPYYYWPPVAPRLIPY